MKFQLLNNDLHRENHYQYQTLVKCSHEVLTFQIGPISNAAQVERALKERFAIFCHQLCSFDKKTDTTL